MSICDLVAEQSDLFFRTSALFRQPSLSSAHNILLLPFTLELWLVILVICIVFVFLLVTLTRTIRQLEKKKTDCMDVQEIIILVHGAFCQQGG